MDIQEVSYLPIIPTAGKHRTNVWKSFQSDFACLMHGASANFGYVAAETAADTAVWGYTEIRKRQCYWLDKKQLLRRILRTTNIALWQKHKEKHYEAGMVVDGACCIFGPKTMWIGSFGSASILEIQKSGEMRMMGVITKGTYDEQKKLGQDRYAIYAASASFPFERGDTVVIAVGSAAAKTREELQAYTAEKSSVLLQTTGSILVVKRL